MALHDLVLSHFSHRRVKAVASREQEKDGFKPHGFWVSVDGEDDWEKWCVAESFHLPSLAIRHRVTLAPHANILLIDSVAGIDQLTRQYSNDVTRWRRYIDWQPIGKLYDGIIIAPYQWERRLDGDAGWYYSWDCASGCIWHPRAIASIEVVTDLLREVA